MLCACSVKAGPHPVPWDRALQSRPFSGVQRLRHGENKVAIRAIGRRLHEYSFYSTCSSTSFSSCSFLLWTVQLSKGLFVELERRRSQDVDCFGLSRAALVQMEQVAH